MKFSRDLLLHGRLYTGWFNFTLIGAWAAPGQTMRTSFFVIPKMYHKSSNIQRNSALSFIHNFGSLSCFWQLRPMMPTTTRTSTVPLDPAEISPPRSSCVFMMLHGHRLGRYRVQFLGRQWVVVCKPCRVKHLNFILKITHSVANFTCVRKKNQSAEVGRGALARSVVRSNRPLVTKLLLTYQLSVSSSTR